MVCISDTYIMYGYVKKPIVFLVGFVFVLLFVYNNCSEFESTYHFNSGRFEQSSGSNGQSLKLVYIDGLGSIKQDRVSYNLEDDDIVIDGDIILSTKDELIKNNNTVKVNMPYTKQFRYDVNPEKKLSKSVIKMFGVAKGDVKFWPEGVVPYEIYKEADFKPEVLDAFRNTVAEFNQQLQANNIKVRFVPRENNQSPYYKITYKESQRNYCASEIGVRGRTKPTRMVLGPDCTDTSILKHEMMHGLGFWHEQNRSDRDDYIDVINENIAPKFKKYAHNFLRFANTLNYQKYDYNSLMHYPSSAMAKDSDSPVIVKKNRTGFNRLIFRAVDLSDSDIETLKEVYGKISESEEQQNLVEVANKDHIPGTYIHKPYLKYLDDLYYATSTHFCLMDESLISSLEPKLKASALYEDIGDNVDSLNSFIENKRSVGDFDCPPNVFDVDKYINDELDVPPGFNIGEQYVKKGSTSGDVITLSQQGLCLVSKDKQRDVQEREDYWLQKLIEAYKGQIKNCDDVNQVVGSALPEQVKLHAHYVQLGFSSQVLMFNGSRVCEVPNGRFASVLERQSDWIQKLINFQGGENFIFHCKESDLDVSVNNANGFDCVSNSNSSIEIAWASNDDPAIVFNLYKNNSLVKEKTRDISHWFEGLEPGAHAFRLELVKNDEVVKKHFRNCKTR